MGPYELKPGDRVRTAEGSIVEVLAESEDGQWTKVRYLQAAGDPQLVGTEDLCHEAELQVKVVVSKGL